MPIHHDDTAVLLIRWDDCGAGGAQIAADKRRGALGILGASYRSRLGIRSKGRLRRLDVEKKEIKK